MREWINANETIRENDAETIQSAVRLACEDGCRKVVVPRYNARTGGTVWSLPTALRLPSHFTLILDNCYMEQGIESYENLITNERSQDLDYSNDPANLSCDISVIGEGNVTLSGGKHNNLLEATTRKYGHQSMFHQPIFYWHNVDGLRVENVHIEHQRWWSMLHIFVKNATIKNIDFYAIPHVPNMDGIDLRVGCSNFTIENITGRTGDDVLALTALFGKGERDRYVRGWDLHIRDVKIRNLKAEPHNCYILRLLNHDNARIFNIDADTLMDASEDSAMIRNGAALTIGSPYYAAISQSVQGDTRDITVKNIYSRGTAAMVLNHVLQNVEIENVHTFGRSLYGIQSFVEGADMDNVTVRNLYLSRAQAHYEDGELAKEALVGYAVNLPKLEGELKLINVEADPLNTGYAVLGGSGTLTVENSKLELVTEEVKTKDGAKVVIK